MNMHRIETPETGKQKRKVHLQTDLLVRLVILAPSGFILNTINTVATDKTVVLMIVCMYVCMYVFIKLHITTQSGPVILVILCHSH